MTRPTTATGSTAPLRRDPDFVRYWTARVVSLAGSAATYVALPVIVYRLTGSPLVTGLVSALEAVPYLCFGLVAGALADRLDRRRVMVAADLLSAAVIGSVPVAAGLHALTTAQVLVVAALAATVFVFFDAANFGALPTLAGRGRIAAANSAVWSAGMVVEIAVPAATGAAFALLAPSSVLAVDAATFVASALLVRAIVRPLSAPDRARAASRRLRAEVREGLHFLWRHPTVRPMTLVGTTQSVSGGAYVGQLVVYADRALGVRTSDPRLGVLYGAWGVGALVASVLLPGLVRRVGTARLTLLALPCSAALALSLAVAPNYATGLMLTALWGVAYMLVVVNAITHRQEATPEPLQSRVNTTGRMLSWGVGSPLGAFLGGAVAQAAGVRWALVVSGLVTAAGAALGWASALRTVRPHVPAVAGQGASA